LASGKGIFSNRTILPGKGNQFLPSRTFPSKNEENGIAYMEFIISTKALFGYRSELVTDSRGLGIINAIFYRFFCIKNRQINEIQSIVFLS